MNRTWSPFLLVFLLFGFESLTSPPGEAAPAASPPTIRSIQIEGNTRTRTDIIRRELLFATGEPLDSLRLAETERNLRQLLFLGQVVIRARKEENGAEVLIQVQDLYSRALSPLLAGKPGELNYGLVALDYNFLGRGQTVRLTLDHQAIGGDRASLEYRVPRLRSGFHDLESLLSIATEGHRAEVALVRPFRRLADRHAYGFSLFSHEQVHRLYDTRSLTARYVDRADGGSIWYTGSFGSTAKFRPGIHLSVTDRRFSPSPPFTYAPQDRRRVQPSILFTLWRPRFEKARFIHSLGPVEDLQTGSWASILLGLSRRSLGSDRDFGFYRIQLSPRLRVSSSIYSFSTLYLSARRQRGSLYHLFSQAESLTYIRLRAVHSLALRLRGEALHRPEDEAQLLLGLDRGLRGYAPRRFDGTRLLLGNLELRPTFYRHPSYVLAGALFLEGGTAWTPSRTSPALNLAAGVGGRIGFLQVYDTPILRVDLAYGRRDDGWQLSFGIGQFF